MRTKFELAALFLGIFITMLFTTNVNAAVINPTYKEGDVYQYELVGPSGTGVFQVGIQAIDVVGNAINVSFVASSNDNLTFVVPVIAWSSNWTSSTTLSNVTALWENINDTQVTNNAQIVLSGFVVFPDLGTPYELHAIDSPQETYYNISIGANGLLINARVRFTGNIYTVRPFSPAIPGYSPVLLALFASTMVCVISLIMHKQIRVKFK